MNNPNIRFGLEGRVMVVTGGAQGIGEACVRRLAADGARVAIWDLAAEAGEALAAGLREGGADVRYQACNVARPADVQTALAATLAHFGRIDGLVNNAGVSQRSLAVETGFAVYQRMVAVDLLAPIALTQALLPRMVQAGGGRIVAIASVAGLVGVPLRSAYCAAKHGLVGYHDAVRAENEHLGIQVHVIAPGSIRTNVSRNALTADGSQRGVSDAAIDKGMPPADAAAAILAAIEAGRRELVLATGAEHELTVLRRGDPEACFDHVSAMVRAGYAQKMAAGSGQDR